MFFRRNSQGTEKIPEFVRYAESEERECTEIKKPGCRHVRDATWRRKYTEILSGKNVRIVAKFGGWFTDIGKPVGYAEDVMKIPPETTNTFKIVLQTLQTHSKQHAELPYCVLFSRVLKNLKKNHTEKKLYCVSVKTRSNNSQ